VFGTLAVDGSTVTFSTARRGLGGLRPRPVPSSLDMAINFKMSCCIRIGPRCDKTTGTLYSETGHSIPRVTEMRYLGIYFVQFRKLKCSLDAAKRGFYRAANSIFSKIGRTASEEVILQIISSKCIPILMYGLETLPLQKNQLHSNRLFMKLFRTTDIRIISLYVKNCLTLNCWVFSLNAVIKNSWINFLHSVLFSLVCFLVKVVVLLLLLSYW